MSDATAIFYDTVPQDNDLNTTIQQDKAMGVLLFKKVDGPKGSDGNWFKLKFKKFDGNTDLTVNKGDLDDQVPVNLKADNMTTYIASEMVRALNSTEEVGFNPKYLGGKRRRSKTSSKRSKNRRSKKSRK
jgi:hypothetical protein